MRIKIKHRVRILKLNDLEYEIYQRKYILNIIPYWHKLRTIVIKDFDKDFVKDVLKYANKIAVQQYPHILEVKHKH